MTTITEYLIEGKKLAESAKAVKFRVDYVEGVRYGGDSKGDKEEWFPFSQVTRMSYGSKTGEPDKIWCKPWIMREKGLDNIEEAPEPDPEPTNKSGLDDFDDDIPF